MYLDDYKTKLKKLEFYEKEFKSIMENEDKMFCLYNLVEDIHRKLRYFSIREKEVEHYYQMEYLKFLLDSSIMRGYVVQDDIKNYIIAEYERVRDVVLDNLIKTIRVWLLRELYYIVDNLDSKKTCDGCKFDTKDGCFEEECREEIPEYNEYGIYYFTKYIRGLERVWKLDKELEEMHFDGSHEVNESNTIGYMENLKSFQKSFCLPKDAQINFLLNLTHSHGNMADKFIEVGSAYKRRAYEFLCAMSEGIFIPVVNKQFYKTTGILPKLIA